MPYLSSRALKGLKQYKYKPAGYTFLDNAHQPFWNCEYCAQRRASPSLRRAAAAAAAAASPAAVSRPPADITEHILPSWLAPNLITLTGLCALVAAYCLTAAQLPEYGGHKERWLYFTIGSAVLFYTHMDALDGKQARKTKTSSPLGQLFDHGARAALHCLSCNFSRLAWATPRLLACSPALHAPISCVFPAGCDALATHLIMDTLMPTLQLRHEWRAIAGIMYVFVPWWLAHWEEYHTGVMLYGNGLWGVTEACYTVVVVHYATTLLGGQLWSVRPFWALLSRHGGAASLLPAQMVGWLARLTMTDMFIIAFGVLGVTMLSEQILRVFRVAGTKQLERTTLPLNEQGNKALGRVAAASHLVQILGTCACGTALLLLPVKAPWQSRVWFGTFGVTYAMQATRLIIAHMSKEPFSVAAWPLALIAAQIANHFGGPLDPFALACAVHAVVVTGYLHYVVCVVGEISGFLGINALTIKRAHAE
jgi:ethanolaminephosphotransferase